MAISDATRQRVRERACFLCEYCHSPEKLSAGLFTIDHLVPRSRQGSDDIGNLALACHRCNTRRYYFTEAPDPDTGQIHPLFNPRRQGWGEHFRWSANGTRVIGTTPTGRATYARLDLNDERLDRGTIAQVRARWVQGGWHPPAVDPREPEAPGTSEGRP